MALALAEARKGAGRTSPNPAVGAVIVRDGQILATGFHRYAGADHAEVAALRTVEFSAPGAELYTTLEPCNHVGRTGPCTEAIISAGIRRVIFGTADPNPRVAGHGKARLEAAGLSVTSGVLERPCTQLNEAWNFAIVHGRPWVVLKAALSLDGRIATRTGKSQWITGDLARAEVHRLRNELDAVLVGIGTVLADDPELTARFQGARNPVRVILDSRLRLPTTSKLVRSAREVRTIVATTAAAVPRRISALEKRGLEVLTLKKDKDGRVSLPALLPALAERELYSVLVEGGAEVHGAFVDRRLVNKLILFMAPMVIGGVAAKGSIGGRGAKSLSEALSLGPLDVRPVGRDLMITAYPES
jgi:diaminohydroxyphosphoribosylaminopyrimidine deaminase/5-amino-6-(5-phosphoribosylamino)uracil reductase